MLPLISVPTPMKLPRKSIRADSPPDDHPVLSSRFLGFNVLPKILLTDSPTIKFAGTFVLTYGIAPALQRSVTTVESSEAGLFDHATYPTDVSRPVILNRSLKLIGSP